MSIRAEAEENLRVIRSLMEKATVYRAISSPAALVGGICALMAAIAGRWLERPWLAESPFPAFGFLAPWLGVLLVATVTNLLLLAQGAHCRGEAFFSPGMRLALRAMLPALLGGGVVTLLTFALGAALVASLWVLFYGIGLLAASHFAPKSICWLGRAFFATGVVLIGGGFVVVSGWESGSDWLAAQDIMGATFGFFHIIYAACTWPQRAGRGSQS